MAAVLFPVLASAQVRTSTVVSSGFANPVAVSSYSMYNGATGGYVYHDYLYPSANANTDYAWLSGGTGILTDGVAATRSWNEGALNGPGGIQGEFVGWYANQTIEFFFASLMPLTHMRVNYDISYQGGVAPPASIWLNGVDYFTTLPSGTEPFWADYELPAAAAGDQSVYFRRTEGEPWLMISEVQFEGPQAEAGGWATPVTTPEPIDFILMASGLAVILGGVKLGHRRKEV